MKKTIFLALLLGIFLSSMVFAADSYIVQSVNGNVKKEVSKDKWETVKVGSTLSPSTVLDTGISGSLVVKLDDKVYTIKSRQKDVLEKLVTESSTGGIKIGGKITSSDIASTSRATSGTTTASTRADSADEINFAED